MRKRAQSHILRLGPYGSPHPALPRPGGLGGPLSPQMTGLRTDEKRDALFLIREETAIMKKLNHPNLVQLIEVLDDPEEDSLYMVMEMCRKGVIMTVGLDDNADPYNEESCRHWFRDLLLGIEYCEFPTFDLTASEASRTLVFGALLYLRLTAPSACARRDSSRYQARQLASIG